MLTLELSTIQAKNAERAFLESAMANYEREGGHIHVAESIGYVQKPYPQSAGFRLPGQVVNTAVRSKDAVRADRIRALAETGAGITSIEKSMGIGKTVIYRIAKEHKIEIKKAWRNGGVVSEKALKAASQKTQERKQRTADKIRALIVLGLSFQEIADRLELHIRTIHRLATEFGLRGDGK